MPCRAMIRVVPNTGVFPCALMIRAVPNISVPCPHDPCPDLASKNMGPFFVEKRAPAATYPQARGFQKYEAFFCGKKSACGNVPTSQGLPEIWGPLFCGEKSACGNVLTSSGLPEIWPPWDSGRKTRFSNGLAYNRSKVSVKKSQIGFVVINFLRSIFPYMSNIYENG